MDISEFKKNNFSYDQRHPWEIARAKIIRHLIKKKNKEKFFHLLDVGSGDAYVLNEFCRHDIAGAYTAVDTAYEQGIIQQLVSASHCNIRFITQLTSQTPPADLILLLDVIEHCKDDALVLQNIKAVSSNEFKLVITVPAFQSLFSEHDRLLLHYRRYTIRQLTDLCKSQHLAIEQAGYFFFSLMLIRRVQLFLEKIGIRKPDKTINNWKGKKWITSFFTSLLWVDYKIGNIFLAIGFRLPGLSAYCICRPLPL